MAENWTDTEIDLIVSDYFEMLRAELSGIAYNKSARRRAIQDHLQRSHGSIEFKHQNISAVMLGLGQPWISGYKPAANFQNALIDGVLRCLEKNPNWHIPNRSGAPATHVADRPTIWIGPPPRLRNEPPPLDPEFMAAIGRKYDVAERDAQNRQLGKAGEELIFLHEQQNLKTAGRSDLAAKVQWTSVMEGDGFGFDIKSFEPNGDPRLLEVKTTNGWERTPFHISRNELAVANQQGGEWHLVRVWNFARDPKAFSIRPPLTDHIDLTPTSFPADLR